VEAELMRALGRQTGVSLPVPAPLQVHETTLLLPALQQKALMQRPQLLALQSLIARHEKSVELANRESYPDFDVKFSYGQRDHALGGMRRDDMVSMTVAMNLPIWRKSKVEPRILESHALLDQVNNLYQNQINAITAGLRQQIALARQNLDSIKLYQSAILPQARLAVESAMAAYRVNQVDFLTLLDNQMTVYNYENSLVEAKAGYNKVLAEIDWLTGEHVLQEHL